MIKNDSITLVFVYGTSSADLALLRQSFN